MVAARADFLAAGHYDPHPPRSPTPPPQALRRDAYGPLVVDAGAGTGATWPRSLDAAAAGASGWRWTSPSRRCAGPPGRTPGPPRRSPTLGAGCRWPTARPRVLLNVFAPRNGAEFHRVLRPDGVLLVVTPAADHLAELVDALGLLRVDPDKADRVAREPRRALRRRSARDRAPPGWR